MGEAENPDVRIEFEENLDPAANEKEWMVRMRSGLEPETERRFPGLPAVESFLARDLQRLYIVKNIAAIQSDEISIELFMAGPKKEVYLEKESLAFRFRAPVDGYLNLINVDCLGNVALLLPYGDESNAVKANVEVRDPRNPDIAYEVKAPFGPEYVKAVFTTLPLDLGFLGEAEADDMEELLELLQAEVRSARGSGDSSTRGAGNRRHGSLGTAEIHYTTASREEFFTTDQSSSTISSTTPHFEFLSVFMILVSTRLIKKNIGHWDRSMC
ncbi:MAG: DUF4384 domain-containing protein [Candidatus Heimdallarchaeota archaeon]|nr:DUF4384 domain-containing protein [Candidatus Heimdallarchaeota archaeon]